MFIYVLTHPAFLNSKSMPKFAAVVSDCLTQGGWEHRLITARPLFWKLLPAGHPLKKWLGYLDQFVAFPVELLMIRLRHWLRGEATGFVLCDQALGPWYRFIGRLPAVIHAHDLLAYKSAMGQYRENPTGKTGVAYQKFIAWGFRPAPRFLAVSERTARDLRELFGISDQRIRVIHNFVDPTLQPMQPEVIQRNLAGVLPPTFTSWIVHVGGGQWYKNTVGLLKIYQAYAAMQAASGADVLPLVYVGPAFRIEAQAIIDALPPGAQVLRLSGINHEVLNALYSGAQCLLFPSLAEGFGWPIIEAQACGTLAVTTDDAPMNEIAGPGSLLLPNALGAASIANWAQACATVLHEACHQTPERREALIQTAAHWVKNFAQDAIRAQYLEEYRVAFGAGGRRS